MAPSGIRIFRVVAELPGRFRLLLVASFLVMLGAFMVMPFMSFFLHSQLKMDMGTVGIVLAVASFVQLSGSAVGGLVADRFGLKNTMVLALAIRTAGFVLFIVALYVPSLVIAALLLTSAGGALYVAPNKAYVVRSCSAKSRPLFLSLSNSALNGGMVLGPLISGLFIMRSPLVVFAAVSGIFALITLLHITSLPPEQEEAQATVRTPVRAAKSLFIPPVIISAFGFYVYMFFQNYMGVYAAAHYSTEVFSLILLLNGILVVVLQPVAATWIEVLSYPRAVTMSFAFFSGGMLLFAQNGLPSLVAGTVLVSLGEIVLFLKNELEGLCYLPDNPAIVFGHQRMAAGIGACASALIGGQMYQSAAKSHGGDQRFWAYCALQGLVVGALAIVIAIMLKRRQPTGPQGSDDRVSADSALPSRTDAELAKSPTYP